jgi:flagellar basal-body rod modification protein FlgD
MATDAIAPASIADAAQSLNLNDLLRVLLTELSNQDPLKPVDNKDFIAQIAQFSSLDVTQQLNQNMQQLLTVQAISQSVGLFGRTVSATLSTGAVINGRVTALELQNGVPRMTIHSDSDGGQDFRGIAIGQLTTIR